MDVSDLNTVLIAVQYVAGFVAACCWVPFVLWVADKDRHPIQGATFFLGVIATAVALIIIKIASWLQTGAAG